MKKRFFYFFIVALLLCFSVLCSCEEKEETFCALTVCQVSGGVLKVELDDGTIKQGRYLQGSTVIIQAVASPGYVFANLEINDTIVATSLYKLVVTIDTTISAVFEKKLESADVIERTQSAFLNTYGQLEYETADGIGGTLIRFCALDGKEYKIVTDFVYSKHTPDSYFCIEVQDNTLTTLFGFYYFDSGISGEAQAYFRFSQEELYYTNVATIEDILAILYGDTPVDFEIESEESEYNSIELLELLEIIYDVKNNNDTASFSVDVSALIKLVTELLETEELVPSYLNDLMEYLPKTDWTIFIAFEKNGGKEYIKDITYEVDMLYISDNAEENLMISIEGRVEDIQLYTWTDEHVLYDFDSAGAVYASIEEIISKSLEFLADFI